MSPRRSWINLDVWKILHSLFFLDSTSGAAIYVLSVVLVIVIAAIFVAAVMIHKKSRVSESHFSLKFWIFENWKKSPWERLSKFIFRFHSWKQKKYKVKRSQLEMLVPLSVPSAVKKQDFTTVNQGQILLVDHWDFSTTIFILLK